MVARVLWSASEDERLRATVLGAVQPLTWSKVALRAGLQRCGKSCRERWMNHLRPGLQRGEFSYEETLLVLRLHHIYGNRWATIAAHLHGRTDNDVKNLWHTRLRKRVKKLATAFKPQEHHNSSLLSQDEGMPVAIPNLRTVFTAFFSHDDDFILS